MFLGPVGRLRLDDGSFALILEDTPENRAFKEKVRPTVLKYKDIGVRVEDSFLLTETGLVRLSARVPRTLEEIEAFMAGRD